MGLAGLLSVPQEVKKPTHEPHRAKKLLSGSLGIILLPFMRVLRYDGHILRLYAVIYIFFYFLRNACTNINAKIINGAANVKLVGLGIIPAKFHDFSVMLTNLKDSHHVTIIF